MVTPAFLFSYLALVGLVVLARPAYLSCPCWPDCTCDHSQIFCSCYTPLETAQFHNALTCIDCFLVWFVMPVIPIGHCTIVGMTALLSSFVYFIPVGLAVQAPLLVYPVPVGLIVLALPLSYLVLVGMVVLARLFPEMLLVGQVVFVRPFTDLLLVGLVALELVLGYSLLIGLVVFSIIFGPSCSCPRLQCAALVPGSYCAAQALFVGQLGGVRRGLFGVAAGAQRLHV